MTVRNKITSLCFFVGLTLVLTSMSAYSQDERIRRDQYMWTDEQASRLKIIAHVWGEVNVPGQYLVPDGTTILELISLAGGPNKFSNLSNVRLTREYYETENDSSDTVQGKVIFDGQSRKRKVIYKVNMKKYLNKIAYEQIHVLKPGDVVQVKRNTWFTFETLLTIITQIAIIIQGLYYTGIISPRN